jgi:hypothetical protein
VIRDSTSWIISGTKSFRLASRKILHKYGGNLANIEKSLREIYVPDDGKIFVQTDQGGAEALIMAYDCEPAAYRQLFIHGIKPHVYVAVHLFPYIWQKKMKEVIASGDTFDIATVIKTPIQALKSVPYWRELDLMIKDSDYWTTSERYYYFAKQTCHSANYDIQTQTFRMNVLEKSGGKIALPFEEAERFLLVYRSLFPEIPERNRRVARQARETRMLFNFFGEPYYISQYDFTENNLKEFYSWCPQSTVGEITNRAFAAMQNYIEAEKLDWDILINGHDSIVSQCPIEEVTECGKKQKEFIEQSFESPVDGAKFNMRSETQAGFNWAPFKKDKNPMGLKDIKI